MEKHLSLLESTQNTRELGGCRTSTGALTRMRSLLRSDVITAPSDRDLAFLRAAGITTIIDLRSSGEVVRVPSGLACADGLVYWNCPIEEGSSIPASVEAVPASYLAIAGAEEMPQVFSHIAHAPGGVLFHCTAGKDRTGVVSAILLSLAQVDEADIVANYLLTADSIQERLEAIHRNCPELDMRIVTPCAQHMQRFLCLFRAAYQDADAYLKGLGLTLEEVNAIRSKLV